MESYINITLDLSLLARESLDLRIPSTMILKEMLQTVLDSYKIDASIINPTARILATVNIGEFTGNRDLDVRLATKKFLEKGIRDTRGYILHHDYKNGIIQLIDKDIHIEFSHYGGYYFHK